MFRNEINPQSSFNHLNVDSRLKNYIDETKKYKNSLKSNNCKNKNFHSSQENNQVVLSSNSNY